MSDATTTEPTADPPQAWGGWRERPLAGIDFGNSVVNHQLHAGGAELTTLGDLDRELRGDPSGPPLRFTDAHRTQAEDKLDELAAGDPAYQPFTPVAEPVVVEGGPTADPDPTSAEALAEYDQETARLVMETEREVSELEAVSVEKHAEASLAKKAFEARRDKARAEIREREANRGKKDLFTGVKGGIPVGQDATSPQPSEDRLYELSQLYPLDFAHWEEFGLTEKDVEKLNAGETKHHGSIPLRTLGDVSRYTNPAKDGYERRLTDIKGIGPGAFERWEAANLQFWQAWPNGKAVKFAAEIGYDLGTQEAAGEAQPDAGGGDARADGAAGDGDPEAGEGAEPAAEQPPERLKRNEQTGELETVGEGKPKAKRKKAKARSK